LPKRYIFTTKSSSEKLKICVYSVIFSVTLRIVFVNVNYLNGVEKLQLLKGVFKEIQKCSFNDNSNIIFNLIVTFSKQSE